MSWSLYVLTCVDGSLYCGITTDLDRRITQHNDGKGAKYTRAKRPVQLSMHWDGLSHRSAARAEYCFKRLSRHQKEVALQNPLWPSSVLTDKHNVDDASADSEE